jgi:hypothetical protein
MIKLRGLTFARIVSLAVVVPLLGVMSGCRKGTKTQPEPRPTTATASSASETDIEPTGPAPLPPAPEITLSINSKTELTLHQGTPLLVTVRLLNQRATNVVLLNSVEDVPARKQPVPAVTLRPVWPTFVRFESRMDGRAERLSWPLTLIGTADAVAITLDGTRAYEAVWGLSPEAAMQLAPGAYRIMAVLEIPNKDGENWQGLVESRPVTLTLAARPAVAQGPDAVQADLALARYSARISSWDECLAGARKAVAKDPASIEGNLLIGNALAARNELDGAIEAYGRALDLFKQQYGGKVNEPPGYLLLQMKKVIVARMQAQGAPTDIRSQGPPSASK